MRLSPVLIVSSNGKSFVLRFRRVHVYMNMINRQTDRPRHMRHLWEYRYPASMLKLRCWIEIPMEMPSTEHRDKQWHNGGVLVDGKSRPGSRPLVRIEAGYTPGPG